jgi:hypothetical protein
MRRQHVLVIVAVLLCADLYAAPSTQPAHELKASDFMRYVDRDGACRLETADVAFRNDNGATVHLVAAVHIGEKDYYQQLNESFKLRDAVLYEMVKPKDMGAPKPGQQSKSEIAQFQRMLKDVLDLDYQLDDIDYTAGNFVHADLDAETFEKMQAQRGESMEMMMMQSLMRAMSQASTQPANQANDDETLDELVKLVTRPDPTRQIKRLLARNMSQIEGDAMGLDGPGGSVILTERNKAALDVLDHTLASGKKDIAIFYGAAHMPDMSRRLSDRGFKPIATQWYTAWDLTIRNDQPSAIEKTLLDAIHDLDSDSESPEPPRRREAPRTQRWEESSHELHE